MKADRKKVWLVTGSRTPIGSFGKSLRSVTVDKLLRHVLRHSVRRAQVKPEQVDGVLVGHGFQSGYTPNTARSAWLEEGLPASVPGATVQRQCGSGMEAIHQAANEIRLGNAELMIAGGCESMSTVPFMLPGSLRWDSWQSFLEKAGLPRMGPRVNSAAKPAALALLSLLFGMIFLLCSPIWAMSIVGLLTLAATYAMRAKLGSGPLKIAKMIGVTGLAVGVAWLFSLFGYAVGVAGLVVCLVGLGGCLWSLFQEKADNGIAPLPLLKDTRTVFMSATAQRVADEYGITRQQADEYALRSQELALKAINSGRFDREIDPIDVPGRGFFARDEHARETSMEKLTKLRGVFGNRDITAGNSSGINDGACVVVLASDEKVKELGVEPLAEVVDEVVVGYDPETMGLGPVVAIRKLLAKHNLTLDDIDLIELNEAFAAQYLGCEKLLGLNRDKVNVNGGAIALGHPIGMSGARLPLTLAHELKIRGLKRGIAALCIGGGQAVATLLERP